MGAQGHPSGPADSMPQGPAPTAPTYTSQTGGPPQAPPVNNQNKDHQDPLECNGSTGAPAESGKGPGPSKGRNKMSEPHPGTSSGTGSTTQPAGSSKNTIVCSACGKSGHWSKIALNTIFVMFVGLPLTLHTCAELLSMETQQPDSLSVYTVVKLIMDQLIVGTD